MNALSYEDTREYMETVSKLETSIYAQNMFLQNLRARRLKLATDKFNLNKKEITPAALEDPGSAIGRFLTGFISPELGFGVIGMIVAFIFWFLIARLLDRVLRLDWLETIVVVIFIALHPICAIVRLLRTPMLKREAQETYDKDLERQHKEEREKREGLQTVEQNSQQINEWIAATESSINETKQTLAKVYAYDVLYPKYRTLAAACTIFEYLDSRRCDMLTGREGAYNLFESELRMNLIIEKLDQISSKLDVIQANQHVLYQAIQETNARLGALSDRVDSSLRSIQASAESAAYHAEITASNTSYLATLETLRLLRD